LNIQITTYVHYSGPAEGLDPLINAIANAVIEQGFASKRDGMYVKSLLSIKESDLEQFNDATEFAKYISKTSMLTILPLEEEETDDSTGD
jgi:hypothetical protein